MTIQKTFIIMIALALPISNLLLQQQQLAMAGLSEDTIERLIPTFDNATEWFKHIDNINKACDLAVGYEDQEDVNICIDFYDTFNEKMREIRRMHGQVNNLLNVEIPYSWPTVVWFG